MITILIFLAELIIILFVFYVLRYLIFRKAAAFKKTDNGEILVANVKNMIISDHHKIMDWRKQIGSKMVGDVQGGDVKLQPGADKLGSVNSAGEIFDKNNKLVGRCNPKGTRSWKQLWLVNRTTVKLIKPDGTEEEKEYGRATEKIRLGKPKGGITLLARAAAVLVLYDYTNRQDNTEKRYDVFVKLSDIALFASLIYAAAYFLIESLFNWHVLFPWLGHDISFVFSMILTYFVWLGIIWFIVYDMAMNGNTAFRWLPLINRNTGLKGWNIMLLATTLIAALICFFIAHFSLFPLYVVIFMGVLFNMLSSSDEWKVLKPGEKYITIPSTTLAVTRPGDAPHNPYANLPAADTVTKKYKWSFESQLKAKTINGELNLTFDKNWIADLRKKNPFMINNDEAIKDLFKSAGEVIDLNSDDKHDDISKWLLDQVLVKVTEIARTENLSQYDTMQLILAFCQKDNFKWIMDDECNEINPNNKKPYDYFRFPVETIYDKRGDCDCTAMMAYRLFTRAGVKAKYILMLSDGGGKHAAVAIPVIKDVPAIDKESLVKIENKEYYFCETVGNGWQVGVLPDNYKDAIKAYEADIAAKPEHILG